MGAALRSAPGTEGGALTDRAGATLEVRGFNTASNSKIAPDGMPKLTEADVEREHVDYGTNTVRFLISWRMVEPEPGRYDTAYLDRVETMVGWYAKRGYSVMLDMHQDVYSQFGDPPLGGNGAPAWAVHTDGFAARHSCGVDGRAVGARARPDTRRRHSRERHHTHAQRRCHWPACPRSLLGDRLRYECADSVASSSESSSSTYRQRSRLRTGAAEGPAPVSDNLGCRPRCNTYGRRGEPSSSGAQCWHPSAAPRAPRAHLHLRREPAHHRSLHQQALRSGRAATGRGGLRPCCSGMGWSSERGRCRRRRHLPGGRRGNMARPAPIHAPSRGGP